MSDFISLPELTESEDFQALSDGNKAFVLERWKNDAINSTPEEFREEVATELEQPLAEARPSSAVMEASAQGLKDFLPQRRADFLSFAGSGVEALQSDQKRRLGGAMILERMAEEGRDTLKATDVQPLTEMGFSRREITESMDEMRMLVAGGREGLEGADLPIPERMKKYSEMLVSPIREETAEGMQQNIAELEDEKDILNEASQDIRDEMVTTESMGLSIIGQDSFFTEASRSAPSAVADLIILLGSKGKALPYMTLTSASSIDAQLKQEFPDMSVEERLERSLKGAGAVTLSERAGLGFLTNKARKSLVGKMIVASGGEASTEAMQTVIEGIAKQVDFNQDAVDEVLEVLSDPEVQKEIKLSAFLGGVLGGGAKGSTEFYNIMTDPTVTNKLDAIRGREEVQKGESGELLGEIFAEERAKALEEAGGMPEKRISLKERAESEFDQMLSSPEFLRDNQIENKEDFVKHLFESGKFDQITQTLQEQSQDGKADVDSIINKAIDRSIKTNLEKESEVQDAKTTEETPTVQEPATEGQQQEESQVEQDSVQPVTETPRVEGEAQTTGQVSEVSDQVVQEVDEVEAQEKPEPKTKISVSVINPETGKTKTVDRVVYKDGKVRVDGTPYDVRKNDEGNWQAVQETEAQPKKSGFIDYTKQAESKIEPVDSDGVLHSIDPNQQGQTFGDFAQKTEVENQDIAKRKGTPSPRETLPYVERKAIDKKRSNLKLRQVVDIMAKTVGVPIRKGGFQDLRDRATARYDANTKVARTRHANDLARTAHEIGHHMSEELGFKAGKNTDYNQELYALGEVTSADSYSFEQVVEEGRAEFFREYLIDPKRAQTLAPKFYQAFEAKLDPKMKKGMEKIQGLYKEVLSQDALERGRAEIMFDKKQMGKQTTKRERVKRFAQSAYDLFIDENYPIKRALIQIYGKEGYKNLDPMKNTYMLKANSAGVAEQATYWIQNGIHDSKGKKISDSFPDIFKDYTQDKYEDATAYMRAKRELEYNKRGLDHAWSIEHINEVIADYQSRYGDYKTLESKAKKWNDSLLKVQLDAGVITQAEYDNMSQYFYFPMQRAYDSRSYNPYMGIKGDTQDTMDGFTVMQENALRVASRLRQEKINRSIIEASQQKGAGQFIEQIDDPAPDDSVLSFVNEDKRYYFHVADPHLHDVLRLQSQDSDLMSNVFLSTMDTIGRIPASVVRHTATKTPLFVMKNLAIDSPTASIQSKQLGNLPIRNSFNGLLEYAKNGEFKKLFELSGAGQGTFIKSEIHKGLKKSDRSKVAKATLDKVNPFNWMESLTNVTEIAPRLEEFQRVYEKAMAEGLSHDSAMEQASYEARNVTLDFSRGGTISKFLNRYIPFFNAGIQGTNRLVQTLRTPQGFGKFMTYVVAPEILLWALNSDDEEFQEIPQWEKDNYWFIPKMTVLEEGESKYLKVPKPRGYSTLANQATWALDKATGKDKEEIKGLVETLRDQSTSTIVNSMPQLIRPWIEYATNYSFFKDRNIVNDYYKGMPLEDQYNDWTSETAKWLGPKLSMSPIMMDHMIYSYTTRYGQAVNSVVNANTKDETEGPVQDFNKTMTGNLTGLSTFFASKPSYNARSVTQLTKMDEQIKGLAKAMKNASPERKAELKEENSELLSQQNKVKGAMSTVRKESKIIRGIYDNSVMTPEAKRKAINDHYAKIIKTSRRALGKPIGKESQP